MAANGPGGAGGLVRGKPHVREDDREKLVAFLDEEAKAFAGSAVDDDTPPACSTIPMSCLPSRLLPSCASARAEAYPIALAMIAEVVEAALAAQAHDRTTLRVAFYGRPQPHAVAASAWSAARAELLRWLGSVLDRLARDVYALLRSAMRVGLATISDRFLICVDAPALAGALAATS